MNYIGKEIIGFKFSSEHDIGYISPMNQCIGISGKIVRQTETYVSVSFSNGEYWNYPIELIDKHLTKQLTMNYSELKILFEVFDNKTKVKDAIRSIDSGYVSLADIDNDNYFNHLGYYYSNDEYCVTNNNYAIEKDDAWYCEGLEEWVHFDDTSCCYEGRDESRYSILYLRRSSGWYYFNGEYYDEGALERHGLVWIEDIGEYGYADDAYYSEDDDCYYSEEREEFVRGYHNGSYHSLNFNGKSKYRIGYEIEKEDENVRNSIRVSQFEEKTGEVWRKEKDGSLCDCSGYELISPTFELDIDKIFEHIEGNEYLVSHINAGISYSCGGHIHLSEQGLDGNELFDKIRGYTPLFYALYYGRVDKNYSKGKSNRDLVCDNEKYQAIKIHHDRVEFRIISAVPNVKTLKWRTKLLRMILENPTDDIIKAYYNVDTKFTKLLKQTYSDEKLVEVKERFIKFTKQFEDINIIK